MDFTDSPIQNVFSSVALFLSVGTTFCFGAARKLHHSRWHLALITLTLWCSHAFSQTAVIKDRTAAIYEIPSTTSRKIAELAAGDTVEILQTRSGWVQLAFRDQQKGWMPVGGSKPKRHMRELRPPGAVAPPLTDGGVSFHLGAFGGDFTYIGRFFYRSLPALAVEGTFQYVAGDVASFYLLHGNARYVWPVRPRYDASLTAGVGFINTVPIRSAGGKSVSNMALNYGLGVQRHLNNKNWLRFELRHFAAFAKNGVANFVELSVGIVFGVNWSSL